MGVKKNYMRERRPEFHAPLGPINCALCEDFCGQQVEEAKDEKNEKLPFNLFCYVIIYQINSMTSYFFSIFYSKI